MPTHYSWAVAWLVLVKVLLDGLGLHQEYPKNNRQQESQHREQGFPVGSSWLALGGSFDPPLGSTVLMLVLYHPMCLFPSCLFALKDQAEGLRVLPHFGMIFSGQLGAGSNELLPKECQQGLAALTAAQTAGFKYSHLKAPGFHSATLLEHFPVAPSKILPFFFLTSFVWSSSPVLCRPVG